MITEKYVRKTLDDIREKLEGAKVKERIAYEKEDDYDQGFYNGVIDTCEDILRQFEGM